MATAEPNQPPGSDPGLFSVTRGTVGVALATSYTYALLPSPDAPTTTCVPAMATAEPNRSHTAGLGLYSLADGTVEMAPLVGPIQFTTGSRLGGVFSHAPRSTVPSAILGLPWRSRAPDIQASLIPASMQGEGGAIVNPLTTARELEINRHRVVLSAFIIVWAGPFS